MRAPAALALLLSLPLAASASVSAEALPLSAWEDLLRSQISRHLGAAWGAPVRFRSFEFALAPPSVTLLDLECSTRWRQWRAVLKIDRLTAAPVLWSLMRGEVVWDQIVMGRVELEVVPAPSDEEPAGSPFGHPLLTRKLALTQGLLRVRAAPLDLESRFSLDGSVRPTDGVLAGVLKLQEIRVGGSRVPAEPPLLSGGGAWEWSASGLSLGPLALRGSAAELLLSARFGPQKLRAEITSTLAVSLIPWRLPPAFQIKGPWKVAGVWESVGEDWSAEGSLNPGEIVYRDRSLGHPQGRFRGSAAGFDLTGLVLRSGEARATIHAHVAPPRFDAVALTADIAALPVEQVAQEWPALSHLGGSIAGSLRCETSLDTSWEHTPLRGTLRLSPRRAAAWPLAAVARVEGTAARPRFSGDWRMGNLAGSFQGEAAQLYIRLSPAPLAEALGWIERSAARPLPGALTRIGGTVSGEAEARLSGDLSTWTLRAQLPDLSWEEARLGAGTLEARGENGTWSGQARLGEEAVASFTMQAFRPETLAGDFQADLTLAEPTAMRVRAAGSLGEGGAARLTATLDVPELTSTLQLLAERQATGAGWTASLSGNDGAQGRADLRLELEPDAGLKSAAGQVVLWRLWKGSPDRLPPGTIANWLELSVDWAQGSGPLAAAVRLLEERGDAAPYRWGEGRLSWEAEALNLELERSAPPLQLRGTVRPGGAWPYRFEALAPDSHVEVAPGVRLKTSFGGSLRFEGTLRPWSWEALLDLEHLAISSEETVWLASGAVRGSGSSAGWKLQPFELRGEAGDLSVSVDPESEDLRARGSLSIAPLGRWLARAETSGAIEADLRWSPQRGARGILKLSGVKIVSDLLFTSVEDLGGEVRLEGDQLHLDSLNGRSGSGTFELRGALPLPGSRHGWDVDLRAYGVPVRQPPGLQGKADLELRISGPHQAPLLSGKVRLLQGVYTLPLRATSGAPLRLPFEAGAALPEALRRLALDLELDAGDLWLRSEFTRLQCQGSVRLSGTPTSPILRGELAALEGGEVRFNDVRYRVASGLMELAGGEPLDPRVSLDAETERGDYTVFLEVRGTLENLQIALRSEPPLPTAEIVRLITTGRQEEPGSILTENPAGGLLGSVVGGRVFTPLESGLQALLPVDRLELDPLAVSGQGDPTARVTLGKKVSRRVSFTYSSNLGNTQDELYQLRYRLQPDVDFTASREDDGSIGGDLRISRRLYPPGARPPAEAREVRSILRRIRFHGSSPLPRRRLRAALTLSPGEPASLYEMVDSQERLWRLHARAGFPEAVIRASLKPRPRGSADAVFEIAAGQPLHLRLEGADLPRTLEGQILDLWQEVELRALVAVRAEDLITAHLREQGYPEATARLAEPRGPQQERVWTFVAQPGRRCEVRALHFPGISQIAEKEVLGAIETRPDFPGGRGFYVASRLRSDTESIRRLYAARGYRQARVELEPARFSAGGREAEIIWTIDEGQVHRVGEVEVAPDAARLFDSPLDRLELLPGTVFSDRALAEDSERLRARLDRRGFPRARVSPRVEGEPSALRLRYDVELGPAQRVGGVSIEGNSLTRDMTIRKELTFSPGGPLSEQRLAESQRNLYSLGVFRSVSVETAGEPSEAEAPVRVRVLESPQFTVGAGLGYDSDDRLRGRLDLSNRNVFGTGRYAGVIARSGSAERRVQLLLRDPRLFGSRLSGLASAFYEEEDTNPFDVIRRGSRLQVEQRPTRRVTLFYRYALSEEDLSDVSVTTEPVEQEQRLANLGWSLAYDSRDDFANPRRGLYGSFDLQWFTEEVASQAEFGRAFLQASYYRALAPRLVWASGIRCGAAEPFRDETSVPLTERFFAGGDNSVRGFKRDQLGPSDPATGDPTGGELSLIFNQELRFPVWRFLHGVAFYDAGNVFTESDDFEWGELRHVLGAGLRVNTPLGPLRLDYGRLVDRGPGEPRGALHLSIGHAF